MGIVGFTPHVLVVRKENYPIKTVDEFVDYAKKHPGEVSSGTSGIGSGPHLSTLLFMWKCGIKMNIIPFPGGAEVMTNLLGGHLDCTVVTTASASDHIKPGGGLRTLVTFDPKRWPDLPDVPTSFEKGYNIKRGAWSGLAFPKGTPPSVLKILSEAARKAINDPQVRANISNLGFQAASLDPNEMKKEVKEEYELAKDAYKKLDIK
jgi:tripartite-type tricarboxylate transporter receptor subunit TctC